VGEFRRAYESAIICRFNAEFDNILSGDRGDRGEVRAATAENRAGERFACFSCSLSEEI
tara:strand:+ start:309 stop:485 length:177 start_codon:yes stop_codon:yes gene_type:complete